MPDLLYTSPRTNRSYTWVPDDPNYVPTDLDRQEYAAYIEQQETAVAQPAQAQPTAEASDSGQSIAGARLNSAIQNITSIPGVVAQGVGATFLSPFGITSLEESGKYAAEKARELTPIDPKYRGNLSVELFGAAGQALGQLASLYASGGGTIGTNVALAQAAAMGAASGAESADRRELKGINRFNEVLGYGATEVLTERIFGFGSKSFFKPAVGLQAKAVKAGTTIGGEMVEEGFAGLGTNIVSNLTAVGLDIPSPELFSAESIMSYGRQSLAGGVGGVVFAGAQMAMGEQATQESITRKSAVIDGVFTNVTGVPDEVLIQRGAEDIKLHTFTSPIDAEAIDSAPDGAKVILESIYGNELEVPIGEPTPEQNQAFDEIIAADAAKKAAAAAAAAEVPPTTPTEAAVLPTEATVPTEAAAEPPITPSAVEPTPTPTPTPNATQIGQVPESNLGQYPDGNEVGTATETGDSDSIIQGREGQPPVVEVQPTILQDETVTQPLPSGALPTTPDSLPETPMTGVSGGVAAAAPVAAAPIGIEAFTSGPLTKNVAKKNVTPKGLTFGNKAKGVPPTASLTPDGNIVFPTPEAAPGVPQQARRTPLNSAVVKQSVQKVFGIVPKNIEFIDTDERVDGKAFVKEQRVQINLRYIQSKERLEKVLREEAFHLIYQDPLVQADVDLLKQEIPDDIKAEIEQLYSDPRFTDSVRLEESVARLVERLSEKTAWQRFVGSVRAAFQKLFGRAPSPRELTLAANRILERAIANVAVQQTGEGAQGTEDAGDVRMSFAGEQSLQNLPEEKRRFMTDSLDAAKAMAAAGKSSEEIRAVTGWFPGKYDGKMRYEVPDANASFVDVGTYNEKTTQAYGGQAFNRISIASIAERVKSGKVVKLSDVFQHDALFAAYPEAANIPFFPIAGTAVQGSHRVIDGQDVITATVTIAPDGNISEASASTILHELQHFIQQKEGFAVGGSPDNLITQRDIADAVKFRDAYLGIRKYKSEIDGLVKVLAEERAKKSFVGFGGPNQKVVKSLEDSIARIQESVNSVWEYQKKNLNVDRDSTRASLLSALNLVDSKLGGAWVLTKRNEGLEMLYRLLSGEVEARDVQARKNLTPEQRKATAPYSSENIAKEDAIVMFGSGGPRMSVTPESQRIDQEYLAAVEAGDMETAQRLVDEAAKAAGYNKKLFHGTTATKDVITLGSSPSGGYEAAKAGLQVLAKKFGISEWSYIDAYPRLLAANYGGITQQDVTESKRLKSQLLQAREGETPDSISRRIAFDTFDLPSGEIELGVHLGNQSSAQMFGEVFPFWVNLGKSVRTPDLGNWNYQSVVREVRKKGVVISTEEYARVANSSDPNQELRQLLTGKGVDSIVYKNEAEGRGDSFIALTPNQIKSADPVTRDDAGNIIPPSKRFQKTSDDIRYSLAPKSPEAQIEQEYKVSVEKGNAAVIASGHELTREVYDELKSKFKPKPRDVFYVADTEVIRNPSDSDRRRMSAEVRSEFGRDSSGDPATRFTKDTFNNTWIWKAHQGMHFKIEPGITSREGVEVNQSNSVPDHVELVQDALRANKPVPLKVQEQYPRYAEFFAKLPPYETSRKTSDDIRYSVTPTVEDANEPEKYFPLTVQIFGEKVVATAVEVQSIREIYETVKSQVFDYTQEVSEDATKAARDLFDRIRPTEEGPADISWLKEIDSRTATPGAVIGALYAYSDKMQDGGRFQQEILDAIELSKYFPTESFTDFWTASGTGGTLREAGRGLNAVSYLINGLNKLQNVHSNRRIRIQAAAKNLGISEGDVRAIDNITSVAPTAEAVAEKMDEIAAKIEKTLLPPGANDPTKNPDNSPATDPKSIEQISAQKLVKDATKKDKKPKDTTQTDAVTAIVQDHLEKKGGQLEADLTRKLTEAGMSPEAAKKLATNTEKKLERDAKKESEREAKALEGAKELSDADRVARRITKKLLSTKDEAAKRKIHPIVALVARYFKANGKLSEEQLENELAALGVSTEIGRELVDAATAELGKRQAIKAARDKARRDNAATKSAENFTKNWEKSQDPAQQTKEKTPDPVRAFLNESSKVLRNQIHFDLSPNGKALFFDTVYTRLINLNVSPKAAMAATSAAYQKYLTNRANQIAKLRDTVAKEGLSKALAKQILNLTRTQQRDPEFAKQFIEQTLIDAGVPQDVANASVPLLLPSFQKALADAREKALMDFINGRPPSAKRIPKEKLDDLRKAVRLGATNPDYQPSTPFAKANGWQNFTRAEHDEMARQDEIASDPLQTNQERQLALSKIAKIASKRMPKNSKLNLASEIYRNSALSNFLSTGGIQVWTPVFSAAVRSFTDGVRGLTQERNLNRFIASLEGFLRAASVPALKAELTSSFGQNITTYNKAYEIDDLSQLHQLLLDGIETWKTTKSPLKKAKSLISITYGSMDYVRRSYAALDNVSQSVFYRQIMDLGMRDIILSKGGSETEFKNLISNRTRRHEQIVTELISQGQSPSRAWVNASELSYRQMNGDLVDIYGDDVAVEIQAKDEMSRKEAARELGVAPDEELDGHVIPVLIDTIKGLSKAADNRFKDSGKLTTLILFGFPITALKVMNRSLDYSFVGIIRGAMSERESKQFANDPEYKSSYPSYKTDTQKQQRMAEAAVGTAAMIMFLMIVLNERDKEPEDRMFMVHNAGPRDRAARQIWRAAGNEPQSVQFRFSKDSPWLGISWAKAGLEVFTPVFAVAGSTFDSMDPAIRREDTYDQIMVFFSQTLASMSRPLSSIQDTAGVISGKEMSLSGRSLANQVGFRASSFLPWSSMARNYNKWQGARDTSNAGSAFAAMIPIVGPSLTEPALNSLGDPVGKTPNEYSYKIGTAIPVSVGFRREDTPLYEFLLNKGKFPTAISRPTQEKKYGQMTNETWRKFVEIRGQTLKSLILQRKESLDKMDSEKYDDMIENLTRIANDRARNELKLRPAK